MNSRDTMRVEQVRAHLPTCHNVQPSAIYANSPCNCGALDTAGRPIPVNDRAISQARIEEREATQRLRNALEGLLQFELLAKWTADRKGNFPEALEHARAVLNETAGDHLPVREGIDADR